jgi:Transglutaminase-like superfamily
MALTRPEPHGVSCRPTPAAGRSRGERLGRTERVRLAAEIVAAYVQARRALRRAPIAAVVASLRSAPSHSIPPTADTLEEARRLGHAVTRTLTLVPGDTRCLARSLVLTRLLARRGMPAKLVIGTRPAPDFLAHAWVEHAGDPVLSPGDGSFGRLVEL